MVPTSTGWPALVQLLDLFGRVAELFFFGAVDDVLISLRIIGRLVGIT
jgi:hypothetical protein